MVDKLDLKSLEGSVLELSNGKKMKIGGTMNIRCKGTLSKIDKSPLNKSLEAKNADIYFELSRVIHGHRHGIAGTFGGNTNFTILYGDYIDSN